MTLLDKILFKVFSITPSYSQCGEDIIIDHVFRQLKKEKISYLDVGTNHPQKTNNTYLFYKNGSSGICVEPNPALVRAIKKKRPKDICLNIGISNQKTEGLDFYVMSTHTLSTFSKNDAEEMQRVGDYTIKEIIKVSTNPLNEIFEKYFDVIPDFVSIDVEGLNEEIIKDLNLIKYRPLVFCVETLSFSEKGESQKLNSIIDKFLAHNYFVYADTYINTIFIDCDIWNK